MKVEIFSLLVVLTSCCSPRVSATNYNNSVCEALHNGSNYTALVTLLLTNKNIVQLESAFYPTNSHPSVVVDVTFRFLVKESQPELVYWDHPSLVDAEIPHHNRELRSVSDKDLCPGISQIKLRWMASPINLYIRPRLLEKLSLKTYHTENKHVVVSLYVDSPCEDQICDELRKVQSVNHTCEGAPILLQQLTSLTANVSNCSRERDSLG